MLAITLGAACIFWSFLMAAVASRFGADVSARFLERGAAIPSNGVVLTHEALGRWKTAPATAKWARPYAYCVIPLDVVFLVLMGGFTLFGSWSLAEAIAWPQGLTPVYRWLIAVFPALYVLADAMEDALVVQALISRTVNENAFGLMRATTAAKMVTATVALLQTCALGVAFWLNHET